MKKKIGTLVVVTLFGLVARASEFKNSYSCGTVLSAVDADGKFGPVAFFSSAAIEYKTGLSSDSDFYTEPGGSKLTAKIFTGVQANYNYRGKITIERDSNVVYETKELSEDFLSSGQFDQYQISFGCHKGLILL